MDDFEPPTQHVVTCFLQYNNRILILKRSDKVRTHKHKWAGVSGYIEPGETDEVTAYKEIREETGLMETEVELVRKGEPIHVQDGAHIWVVHPFLFRVQTDRITIDWEHTEYKWILPDELQDFDFVVFLDHALKAVID
ncbi:NUDIX domain-containing protein [[Eubacterium] cellulosolvens]